MLICCAGCKIGTTCLAQSAWESNDRLVFHGVDAVGPGRDTSGLPERQRHAILKGSYHILEDQIKLFNKPHTDKSWLRDTDFIDSIADLLELIAS